MLRHLVAVLQERAKQESLVDWAVCVDWSVGTWYQFVYHDKPRRVRVEEVHAWGVVVWDERAKGKDGLPGAYRSYRYDKMSDVHR